MELATIFLIWLAVTIIDNLAKRKRRLPPPDFDIPTLGNEEPIVLERPRQAEVRPSEPPIKKASAQIHEAKEPKPLNVNLTTSTVLNAFVLSEIIGKPKALRRPFVR